MTSSLSSTHSDNHHILVSYNFLPPTGLETLTRNRTHKTRAITRHIIQRVTERGRPKDKVKVIAGRTGVYCNAIKE